jgi:hypothetical protein
MSEEVQDEWAGLEIHIIPPGQYFTNLLWNLIHRNKFDFHLKIGLGHTPLMSKLVVIGKATEAEIESEKIKKMEGEVLSE